MTSLLDDVNVLLNNNHGDRGRLLHIKETINKNKILYISDREYLTNLCKKYLDQKTPEVKKQRYVKYSEKSEKELYFENDNIVNNNKVNEYSTQSHKSNLDVQDVNRFCINCGNQIKSSNIFCINCGMSQQIISNQPIIDDSQPHNSSQTQSSSYQQKPITLRWYLLPILLGWFGGVIAYILARKRNPKRAKKMIIVGFIPTIAYVILLMSILSIGMLDYTGQQNGIADILSQFSGLVQSIDGIIRNLGIN